MPLEVCLAGSRFLQGFYVCFFTNLYFIIMGLMNESTSISIIHGPNPILCVDPTLDLIILAHKWYGLSRVRILGFSNILTRKMVDLSFF